MQVRVPLVLFPRRLKALLLAVIETSRKGWRLLRTVRLTCLVKRDDVVSILPKFTLCETGLLQKNILTQWSGLVSLLLPPRK